MKQQLLKECDIKKCDCTTRHHDCSDDKKEEIKPFSPKSDFYKRCMDSLHFYVMHMFDCGLRVHHQDNEQEEEIKDHDDGYDDASVDKQFARILKAINERRQVTLLFTRFRNNTKFNMTADQQNQGINHIVLLYINVQH